MSSQYCSILPKFTDLMSKRVLYNELVNSECLTTEDCQDLDDNLYDINELEEVFSDHILMGKRLQKTLYGGSIKDLDDNADHPPIALTDLALKLFSKTVPNYGLDQLDMDYVSSVSEATSISPCAMILALMYLERLRIKNSDYLESVSPSGLFVVTMMVASKFLFENEEDIVTNQIWSEALNIDVKELNQLEKEFLSAIDWHLYIDSSDYFQYLSNVERIVALKQSSFRGWLSYTDIYSIIQDAVIKKTFLSSIESIIKVFTVSVLSYTVTVFSLYTATLAIQNRCTEPHLLPSKHNAQIMNDTQNSLPVFNVVEESDAKLPYAVIESSAIFSSFSFDNQDTYHKTSNFDYSYQGENKVLTDNEIHPTLTYNSIPSSEKVEFQYNFYIYNNSFLYHFVSHPLYKLHWLSSNFKNNCISVLVQ